MSLFREPDAGKLPVRFDEREQETGPSQTGLRGRGESRVTHPPGGYRYCACSRLYSPLQCAGLNRLEAEEEEASRERTSDPLGPEFCVGHREVHDEA